MRAIVLLIGLAGVAAPAYADSTVKNETSEHQFFAVRCSDTNGYEMQVDPGRRVVIPSSDFDGGTCSLQVEGQDTRYTIHDHNGYQIQKSGKVTKTAG